MRNQLKKCFAFMLCMTLMLTSMVFNTQPTEVKAAATTPQSGQIYYLKNKNSGMYLQVAGNSSNAGANVVQSAGTGSEGQRWVLEKITQMELSEFIQQQICPVENHLM